MNRKELTDVIVIILVIAGLFIHCQILSYRNRQKDKKIDGLENKVHQQIELIDALKQ